MSSPTPQHTQVETRNFPARWRWVAIAAILLAILSEISGSFLKLDWLTATSPHLQFLMLCAALICLAYAFADRPSFSGIRFTPHSLILSPLLVITVLALLIRLWHNGDAIRVLVDEMNFLSGMTNFWKPEPVGILTPMDNISPFTWLFPYWQANFVGLFGRNLATLRAVSAVVGALNIPALYLLAATLFNRKTALTAAFLLAVFPPHIHFSRIALLSITDPLMGTLALAFLARGMRYGRHLDYALAGVFLGLTQYFFEGGRLLYIPLAAIWFVTCWLFTRRKAIDKSNSLQQSISSTQNPELGTWNFFSPIRYTILCTLLVGAPVYYTLFAIQKPLTGRMDASGLSGSFWSDLAASPWEGGLRYLVNHLSPAIRIYALLPDQTAYYGGDTALLLPALVPFFLIGLIVIFRRIRSPGSLLLLWLLAVSAGNSLLLVSAASTRYVVVLPALALITALGLVEFLQWLFKRFQPEKMYNQSNQSPFAPPGAKATGLPAKTSLLKGLVNPLHSITTIQSPSTPPSVDSRRNFLPPSTQHLALSTILFFLAIYQLGYYFGPHLANFDARFRETRPNYDIEDAVYRALDFPPNTQVHLISRVKFDEGYGTRFAAFFRDDLPTDGFLSNRLDTMRLRALPRDVNQVFFLETEDTRTLAMLQLVFNSALEGPFFSPYNVAPEKHFVMFSVRRQP